MENYSFHPLLLQWQECRGAIISNYCARFGKQSGSLFNRLVKEVSLSLLNGNFLPLYYLWEVIIF
jgi:hypothetical protein